MTVYEQKDGLEVQKLYLTITGTDAGCDEMIGGDDARVIVARAKAGKITYVPKSNADGEEFYQRQQVLQITEYELIPPGHPDYEHLAKGAITATDGRRQIQPLPFGGTEDLPPGEGPNETT